MGHSSQMASSQKKNNGQKLVFVAFQSILEGFWYKAVPVRACPFD